MGRVRSLTSSAERWRSALTLASVLLTLLAARLARAELEIAPSADGYLGAWLIAGPVRGVAPKTLELSSIEPRKNGTLGPALPGARFRLAAVADGALDLEKLFSVEKQSGAYAFAGGTLLLSAPLDGWLLVSADGGIGVAVDGRTLFEREVSRLRDQSWDVLPLKLAAGRHRLVLRLHQNAEHWAFSLRVLERRELLAPRGGALLLEGTGDADRPALLAQMLGLRVSTGLSGDGYRPKIALQLSRGAPRGAPLEARVRLRGAGGAPLDLRLGRLAFTDRGVHPLEASLPSLPSRRLGNGPPARIELEAELGSVSVKRTLFLSPRAPAALAAADELGRTLEAGGISGLLDAEVVAATLAWRRARVARLGAGVRANARSVESAIGELEKLGALLESRSDPLKQPGVIALARRSDLDGRPQRLLVHVPQSYAAGGSRRYPLVVVLHGFNGSPRRVLNAFLDSPKTTPHPRVDGFVVAPHAHGNSFYRGAGEREVLRTIDWMLRVYPIDPERVSITGVSMGGTGTALLALRHADRFAAAAPLSGYQSYFVRRDVADRPIRPWERDLMHRFSPTSFAENGRHLPLLVAHGTKDFPLENSKVLIGRYKELGYPVVEQWPEIGHDAWRIAWQGARLWPWLTSFRRDPAPASITLKTEALRYGELGWVRITALSRPGQVGRVDARVAADDRLALTTDGVAGLSLERPSGRVASGRATLVEIDGTELSFAPKEPILLSRAGTAWKKAASEATSAPRPTASHAAPRADRPAKRPGLEGPVADVFNERLVFVYGSLRSDLTRANREVAEWLARGRQRLDVRYAVLADRDLEPSLASEVSLVLVGNAESHAQIRELDRQLPIRVDGAAIVAGSRRFSGSVGAIFIHPNPRATGRYLLLVEGVDARGIWAALSLPQLIPDFLIYDEQLAAAAGQQVLGMGSALGGGFFGSDWSLPSAFADPQRAK